jgi:CTP synthase (UTP-ammonia lyase)
MTRIAVIGDNRPENETHRATSAALAAVQAEWIATDEVDLAELQEFDGVFVAPGSPYRSMDGALSAIQFARERGVPLVGT